MAEQIKEGFDKTIFYHAKACEVATTRPIEQLRSSLEAKGHQIETPENGGISAVIKTSETGDVAERVIWDDQGRVTRLEFHEGIEILESGEVFVNQYKFDEQGRLVSSMQLVEGEGEPKVFRGTEYHYKHGSNDYSLTRHLVGGEKMEFNSKAEADFYDEQAKERRRPSLD